GANELFAQLKIADFGGSNFAREKFAGLVQTIFTNVCYQQVKVLYNGEVTQSLDEQANNVWHGIYYYLLKTTLMYDKTEHWELLGTTMTIKKEIDRRSKSYVYIFTVNPRVEK
ncbi:MAG: hypothetical protein HQK91_05750, partial [Nitrospirae bacterium]|nr:hypothetical protein [Nitrospirota bacterium]